MSKELLKPRSENQPFDMFMNYLTQGHEYMSFKCFRGLSPHGIKEGVTTDQEASGRMLIYHYRKSQDILITDYNIKMIRFVLLSALAFCLTEAGYADAPHK